jgi:nucleoside-diphosphate-sugar epimerase
MNLIVRTIGTENQGPHVVAVFGSGLVGGSIIRSLKLFGISSCLELPLSWTDAGQRALDLVVISKKIGSLSTIARLDVIWAAGNAGFGATSDEANAELPAYCDVLNWALGQNSQAGPNKLVLHVLSSAGGLFEGQRFVDGGSSPEPKRPYGVLKLEQEHIAQSLAKNVPVCVYRPSSIYGTGGKKGRSGLINTLILNHKKQAVSRIFGGFDTLRDYVLAADIGGFIARQTAIWPKHRETHLLASGKPTTVAEIQGIIEKIMRTPLFVKLDPVPSNASHITFRVSALPDQWRPTDLETGIRLVMRQLSEQFEAVNNS